MKYIVLDQGGIEQPIVFSEAMTHKNVADGFFSPVVSAGFCYIYSERDSVEVSVWGRSESLNINGRREDANLIRRAIAFSV